MPLKMPILFVFFSGISFRYFLLVLSIFSRYSWLLSILHLYRSTPAKAGVTALLDRINYDIVRVPRHFRRVSGKR